MANAKPKPTPPTRPRREIVFRFYDGEGKEISLEEFTVRFFKLVHKGVK